LDLEEVRVVWEDMDWIDQDKDRGKYKTFLNTVMHQCKHIAKLIAV
jgi:hypothetical protein